jgi:hypothetical protein
MKKKIMLLSTLVAAMLMTNATVSEARTHALDVKVKLVKSASKKLRVVANQPSGLLNVSLYNESGELLYSGQVQTIENLGKQFDLTALADGKYSLTVGGDTFNSTQRVVIKDGNLTIDTESYNETVKPEVKPLAKNQFIVALSVPTSITITDVYGEELYSAVVNESKRYDLSTLPSGKYVLTFVIGGSLFTETVNVVK